MKFFAVAVLCALAIPSHAQTTAPVATADASQDRHEVAFKRWQFANLRDPDSAISRQIVSPYRTTVTLKRGLLGKKEWLGEIGCYALNSKNAYGAYAGYTTYAVLIADDAQEMVFEGMPANELGGVYRSWGQQIIDVYCKR